MYGVDGAAVVALRPPACTESQSHSMRDRRRWLIVDAVNQEIGNIKHDEYRQWRRQTDGVATKFKTEFATEVHLNIDLQPDFSVQNKHRFKPET